MSTSHDIELDDSVDYDPDVELPTVNAAAPTPAHDPFFDTPATYPDVVADLPPADPDTVHPDAGHPGAVQSDGGPVDRGHDAAGEMVLPRRPLMTVDELCDLLRVTRANIYKWRVRGYGPTAIKVGRELRWHPDVVDAWLASNTD